MASAGIATQRAAVPAADRYAFDVTAEPRQPEDEP